MLITSAINHKDHLCEKEIVLRASRLNIVNETVDFGKIYLDSIPYSSFRNDYYENQVQFLFQYTSFYKRRHGDLTKGAQIFNKRITSIFEKHFPEEPFFHCCLIRVFISSKFHIKARSFIEKKESLKDAVLSLFTPRRRSYINCPVQPVSLDDSITKSVVNFQLKGNAGSFYSVISSLYSQNLSRNPGISCFKGTTKLSFQNLYRITKNFFISHEKESNLKIRFIKYITEENYKKLLSENKDKYSHFVIDISEEKSYERYFTIFIDYDVIQGSLVSNKTLDTYIKRMISSFQGEVIIGNGKEEFDKNFSVVSIKNFKTLSEKVEFTEQLKQAYIKDTLGENAKKFQRFPTEYSLEPCKRAAEEYNLVLKNLKEKEKISIKVENLDNIDELLDFARRIESENGDEEQPAPYEGGTPEPENNAEEVFPVLPESPREDSVVVNTRAPAQISTELLENLYALTAIIADETAGPSTETVQENENSLETLDVNFLRTLREQGFI